MLSGNFGTSIRMGLPVLPEVLRVGLSTLILTIGSLIITLLIAVPIALYSAVRGTNKISWPLTMSSYVISALPVFWFGSIFFFPHELGLFPVAFGFSSAGQKYRWLYQLLPIFVLGVGNGTISEVIRFLREEMGRAVGEAYIRSA